MPVSPFVCMLHSCVAFLCYFCALHIPVLHFCAAYSCAAFVLCIFLCCICAPHSCAAFVCCMCVLHSCSVFLCHICVLHSCATLHFAVVVAPFFPLMQRSTTRLRTNPSKLLLAAPVSIPESDGSVSLVLF